MGATRREIIYKVIFPSAAPAMLTTCRITLGWAWTYLVVAEIVAANSGLGYAVLKAQRFLQTDKIFAGLIVIGIIGLLQDQLLRALHHVSLPVSERTLSHDQSHRDQPPDEELRRPARQHARARRCQRCRSKPENS